MSALEIKIANVSLAAKLDALGALLDAIREAHRAEISRRSWASLQRAQENIADAIIHANEDKNSAFLEKFSARI